MQELRNVRTRSFKLPPGRCWLDPMIGMPVCASSESIMSTSPNHNCSSCYGDTSNARNFPSTIAMLSVKHCGTSLGGGWKGRVILRRLKVSDRGGGLRQAKFGTVSNLIALQVSARIFAHLHVQQ
jgi:hypothetical protein